MSPDYVVLRGAPDLPSGFMPPDLDGKWFDRADFWPRPVATAGMADPSGPQAVAVPTGRFEVREDGALAEVFEFQV